MRPIVNKDELLTILEDNRARHREVFEAALEGFHEEAQRQLRATVKRVRDGLRQDVLLRLQAPQDHTRDYDRAIRMIEMHQGDTMTLSEEDIAQYVMDDWGWKGLWLQNSGSYAAASVAEHYGEEG